MTIETTPAQESFAFDPEILAAMKKEYDELIAEKIATQKAYAEPLVAAGEMTREQADKELALTAGTYADARAESVLAHVINNLHFWLPGGWNRELATSPTPEQKKLMAAIDALVAERGPVTPDINSPENLQRLARIYLALKSQGFPHTLLRT